KMISENSSCFGFRLRPRRLTLAPRGTGAGMWYCLLAMRLRALALAFAVAIPAAVALDPGAPLRSPAEARAAVSILLSLDELVGASSYVVVGTGVERYSQWEELAGGRRIVTYTRVQIERPVVGNPGSEIWVRTLGGAVGKIGQSVSGEAQIAIGKKALFF